MEPHGAPLKILISDFKNISRSTDEEYKWKTTLGKDPFKKTISLKHVWLQGLITNVDGDTSVRLWDRTGEAVVRCEKVYEDKTWLKKGVYCSVIAEILQPTTDTPSVLAIRLINLSDQQHTQQEMWFYEVSELAHVLVGRIANPFSDDN